MNANDIIQLLGMLYFIFALAFIINKEYYKDIFKEIVKSKNSIFIGGYISLVLGFILTLFFNELMLTREGLVTLFGYIALIKGVSLLLFPKVMMKFIKTFTKTKYFDLICYFTMIFGILLLLLSFI